MGGPKEDPRFATNPDSDDISEPTANRIPGFVFQEEIANEFFNWLAQTWGGYLEHFANHGQEFFNFKRAVNHPRIGPGDHFVLDTTVDPSGSGTGLFSKDWTDENGTTQTRQYSTPGGDVAAVAASAQHVVVADVNDEKVYILDTELDSVITTVSNFTGTWGTVEVATDGESWTIVYEDTANSQTVFYTTTDFSETDAANLTKNTTATQYTIKASTNKTYEFDNNAGLFAAYDGSDAYILTPDAQQATTQSGVEPETIAGASGFREASGTVNAEIEFAFSVGGGGIYGHKYDNSNTTLITPASSTPGRVVPSNEAVDGIINPDTGSDPYFIKYGLQGEQIETVSGTPRDYDKSCADGKFVFERIPGSPDGIRGWSQRTGATSFIQDFSDPDVIRDMDCNGESLFVAGNAGATVAGVRVPRAGRFVWNPRPAGPLHQQIVPVGRFY